MLQAADSVFTPPAPVDHDPLRSFRARAENALSVVRSGILIFLQDERSICDLQTPLSNLKTFTREAQIAGLADIAAHSAECAQALTEILNGSDLDGGQNARRALDLIAAIEASLLSGLLHDDDFYLGISGFLDESFEQLTSGSGLSIEEEIEEFFEIDEETMEIFRSEASELIESISANLQALTAQPNDRDALWNIRRSAHTFKGAAGVIGLKEASELAHRVEDLLDRMAENDFETTASIIELLTESTGYLESLTSGGATQEHRKSLAAVYADFDRLIADSEHRPVGSNTNVKGPLSEATKDHAVANSPDPAKPPPAPIARVALDKLDELMNLTRSLAVNRSSLVAAFDTNADSFEELASFLEEQLTITNLMQEKLLQIRMVRFGMLTTRLNRAVHVTCQEEDKKVELIVENEDLELDTQILDCMVEPLLHLLRNAVVHGIEPPERRRLIAKPERGQIRIQVESGTNEIVISVQDDGRGISVTKLREKAVSSRVIDATSADSLTDAETLELIFERGLTTAEKLNINAGRGVGMSIVRESVGSIGGSISIETELQRGTTFTIRIPLVSDSPFNDSPKSESLSINYDETLTAANKTNDRRILIVDDSSSVRQLLKRFIENAGWKCIIATDGQNALEMLTDQENRPDVILTDLEMPNINGYELLETLKADVELRAIPVVMLTSRRDGVHRDKAFELGAADFLTKPFDENVLIKIIDRHCPIMQEA